MPATPKYDAPNGVGINWVTISVANGAKGATPTRPQRDDQQITARFQLEPTKNGVTVDEMIFPEIQVDNVAESLMAKPNSAHKAKALEFLQDIGPKLFFLMAFLASGEGQCDLPVIPT